MSLTFEEVSRLAGLPFDGTIEAMEAEEAEPLGIGETSDESEGRDDDEEGPEDRGDLRDDGRSFGQGESYAERNT